MTFKTGCQHCQVVLISKVSHFNAEAYVSLKTTLKLIITYFFSVCDVQKEN